MGQNIQKISTFMLVFFTFSHLYPRATAEQQTVVTPAFSRPQLAKEAPLPVAKQLVLPPMPPISRPLQPTKPVAQSPKVPLAPAPAKPTPPISKPVLEISAPKEPTITTISKPEETPTQVSKPEEKAPKDEPTEREKQPLALPPSAKRIRAIRKRMKKVMPAAQLFSRVGGHFVNVAKMIANPVATVREAYKAALKKHFKRINDLMQKAPEKLLEGVGAKESEEFQPWQASYSLFQQKIPEIQKNVKEFIDTKIKDYIVIAHNRMVIPLLVNIYKVPFEYLSYSSFLMEKTKKDLSLSLILNKYSLQEKETVIKAYFEAYSWVFSTLEIDPSKVTENIFETLSKQFEKILPGVAKKLPENPKELLKNLPKPLDNTEKIKILQNIADNISSDILVSKGIFRKTQVTTDQLKKKLNNPALFLQLQLELSAAHSALLAQFYEKEISKIDPQEYFSQLYSILFPKFLLTHFQGKTIPGIDFTINEDNLPKILETIQTFRGYVGRVEKIYKTYQQIYEMYQITIELTKAISNTLQLIYNPKLENYYSKVFDSLNTYSKIVEKLIKTAGVEEYDLGVPRAMAAPFERFLPKWLHPPLPAPAKRKKEKKGAIAPPPSHLLAALGTLRYCSKLYQRLHNAFIHLFAVKIDKSGQRIYELDRTQIFTFAKSIIAPAIKNFLYQRLIDTLSAKLGKEAANAITTGILGTVQMIRQEGDVEEAKERMIKQNIEEYTRRRRQQEAEARQMVEAQ